MLRLILVIASLLILVSCSYINRNSSNAIIYEIVSLESLNLGSKIYLLPTENQFDDIEEINILHQIGLLLKNNHFVIVNDVNQADYIVNYSFKINANKASETIKYNYVDNELNNNIHYKMILDDNFEYLIILTINIFDNHQPILVADVDKELFKRKYRKLIWQSHAGLITDRLLINRQKLCMLNAIFINDIHANQHGIYNCSYNTTTNLVDGSKTNL